MPNIASRPSTLDRSSRAMSVSEWSWVLLLLFAATATAQSFTGSAALDLAINTAIHEKRIPGAVLLVGQKGQIVHR